MPNFTPGPWKVLTGRNRDNYPYQIIGALSGVIITTWGSICRKATREGQANADLIATAPELFEALTALRSFMWSEGYADQTAEMAKADAALAKAEGK
jgi:hypothetical protein